MPPCFAAVPAVRKEVRGIVVRAPTHIVDPIVSDADAPQLRSQQRSEVAMNLPAFASDYRTAVRCTLHLESDVITDFERVDTNMWPDRDEQRAGVVGKQRYRSRDDAGHGAAPACMHSAHTTARQIGDENGNAIGSACCDGESINTRDECITLQVRCGFGAVGFDNFAHIGPVHLPLLEEAISPYTQHSCEARAILPEGRVVIAQMKSEVPRVIRRRAHTTRSCRKRMDEAVLIQKGRTSDTHSVVISTARLREPLRHAKEAVPKPGQGVGLCIDFLPRNGQRR